MRNLAPAHHESVLDAMDLSVERGSYPCLRSFINDYRDALRSSPIQSIRDRFDLLERISEEGEAHEAVHGRYSKLKLSHPFNVLLVAQGIVEDPARQFAIPQN